MFMAPKGLIMDSLSMARLATVMVVDSQADKVLYAFRRAHAKIYAYHGS